MEIVIGIIIGVIALTLLVATHELGHGIVARRNGVVVEEFGIGFPPQAYSKVIKKSILGENVRFSLNWLPLGGFVKLQGEHDAADQPGDYGAATFWQKTKILLAGVTVNWLTAVVLLTGLAWVGLPKMIDNQFYLPSDAVVSNHPVQLGMLTPGLPAAKAGLRQGDAINQLAGQTVRSTTDLAHFASQHKGETVPVVYTRGDKQATAMVALRKDNPDRKGYLGAELTKHQDTIRATWSAPIVGVVTTAQLTRVTLQGLGDMVVNLATSLVQQFSSDSVTSQQAKQNLSQVGNAVAGPVGIFAIIFPAAGQAGVVHVLLLTAIIALSLAVMNILPIPALDGGRWTVMAIFRLLRKPLSKQMEENIQAAGFLCLLGLIVLVTIADIGKLVH
ncbi:site-2 protease family protein [Candidatus Saccharibacteria bacterium]|nr:site-2 protease family protein [Candidatus Saccharibacteria bacterium]